MEVGARLAGGGDAIDGADRLAVDQHDALVALAHRRKIALHHDRLAVELGEHLEQGVEVLVLWRQAEHARAAIAEERLQDDVAVLGAEGDDLGAVAGDEGRRHEARKARGEELFRRVAHARRVVHDQHGVAHMLEQMRRRDVGHVEGRVLAHQDHVHPSRSSVSTGPKP